MTKQLLRQCLDALCLPCARWNRTQTLIIDATIEALRAELAKPEAEVVAWARLRADGRAPDVVFQETAPDESYDFPLFASPPDTEAKDAALRVALEALTQHGTAYHGHVDAYCEAIAQIEALGVK